MQIKDEKGLVGTDISIAVIIVVIFVTIITTIFYQIGMSHTRTRRHAAATDLAVNLLENIELMPYDEFLTTDLNELWTKKEGQEGKIKIPKGYEVEIKRLEENEDKQDYVKEVRVSVHYKVGEDGKNITIKTLKQREN